MATLGSDNFELGWIPDEDATRGKPNGLLRMDNLNLDENSNVSLTRGTLKMSGELAEAPVNLFSVILNSVKHRYTGTLNGTVLKDVDEAKTFDETVLSGGSSDTAYGATLGQVLICSGTKRKKDDGTYIRNLGIPTPEPPSVVLGAKYSLDIPANYTASEGTGSNTILADSDTFRIVGDAGSNDLTAIQGGLTDTHSDTDVFTLWIKPDDSTLVRLVRLEFIVTVPDSSDTQVANYYYKEWDFTRNLEFLNKGLAQDIGLSCVRNEFEKMGFGSDLGWDAVSAIRVIIENAAVQSVELKNIVVEGGQGSLIGRYQYIQVDAFESGEYEARSVASEDTDIFDADHQFAHITPNAPSGFNATGNENETNKIYIYRRNLDIGGSYTLVAIRTDLTQFTDEVTDDEAVEGITGSDTSNRNANLFLEELPDNIIDLVPNYFRRTLYITADRIKVSDLDNPDSIDSRFELDTSGESGEVNLWSVKVAENSLLIGTTIDIYSITGTLQVLSDGTPDVRIRALGINPPPNSEARAVYNGSVIYMSGSGWRILAGSTNESLLGGTRLLYDNKTRYDIQPVLIGSNNLVSYDCVISKSKLFTTVTLADGVNRRCYVYDFVKRYWYPYFLNPVSLFVESDGTILASFGGADDYYVRQIDVGEVLDTDDTLQSLYFQTSYNDGSAPNNRKDTKVLKIYADSDDAPVTIYGSKDGEINTWVNLGTFQFNGPYIQNINLAETDLALGKSFAIRITSSSCRTFKFYYWTVENDPRPEQLNFLRVPPTNFGHGGRKRFYDLGFSLDALGNNFTVTPILDGIPGTPETFAGTNRKDFYTIAFREPTVGHELGINIQFEGNSVGEFYELIAPKHTESLPDLSRWFRIPFTNLNTPSRKRFVRIALVLDTRGKDVSFTPLVDDSSLPPLTFNTDRKKTVIYYITEEVIGTDLGGIIDGGETPFEFYGLDFDETITEALPGPSKFIYGCTDFESAARKRFSRNSFVCNPRGGSVGFTPILDGVRQPEKIFSGNRKETFSYYYIEDKIYVDLCFEIRALTDEPFEFYNILRPERLEVLPEPVKFFRIPRTNLGTDARKRIFAFAFTINTLGHNVRFTPYIDGVALSESSIHNVTSESTAIHYFNSEIIGHDIGGNLETVDGELALPFEFYGVNTDETISEKVPGPAKYLVIPPENLGVAARKRLRTLPMVINSRGGTVRYTPYVDGVAYPSSDHSTSEKRTVLHYFETDSFGIDYGGILESTDDTPFEFYGLGQPENVQTLPVGKKFDQVGPIEFERRAWIRRIRVRMVNTGTSFTWRIYDKDSENTLDGGVVSTLVDKEKDYDISLIKGVQGSVFRIELQSESVFHRYYVTVWHSLSGAQTDLQQTKLS